MHFNHNNMLSTVQSLTFTLQYSTIAAQGLIEYIRSKSVSYEAERNMVYGRVYRL